MKFNVAACLAAIAFMIGNGIASPIPTTPDVVASQEVSSTQEMTSSLEVTSSSDVTTSEVTLSADTTPTTASIPWVSDQEMYQLLDEDIVLAHLVAMRSSQAFQLLVNRHSSKFDSFDVSSMAEGSSMPQVSDVILEGANMCHVRDTAAKLRGPVQAYIAWTRVTQTDGLFGAENTLISDLNLISQRTSTPTSRHNVPKIYGTWEKLTTLAAMTVQYGRIVTVLETLRDCMLTSHAGIN